MYADSLKLKLFAAAAIAAISFSASAVWAQDASSTTNEVVVTGTRETSQTQFTALSPVDVFSGKTVNSTVTSNLDETLAQLVPSFNVKRLPASDGPEFIRPAALDGLSPDMTLVLLDGKRFHSSAFIESSGQSAGSQGPDLAQIPTFAIGHVEVLRDGASAQYGSDAIAGVINIILDTKPGFDAYAQGSQFYAGDGGTFEIGSRAATALPGGGHLMVTGEYANAGATSRTAQRPDAISFQAANPTVNVPNPVQRWGNPDTVTVKSAFDGAEPIGDAAEAYIFGTIGDGKGISDINWRNPSTNASIYKTTAAYPTFNLNSLYPAGFTPHEGVRYNDQQVDLGVRQTKSDVFTWDLSASYGHNDTDFILNNSINASLGPNSPLNFNLGHQIESEFDLNADGDYHLRLAALPSPINIAFGVERRVETFEVRAGDPASYAVGPGAAYGLTPESNGFPGFSPAQAGAFNETSYAGYIDAQTQITRKWSVEFAAREESYNLFGDSFNYKVASRYELRPDLALRGSFSTGFKAPTPGQLYSTSVSQGLDTKTLLLYTTGRLSPSNPVAELFGAKPLTPEESQTISGGFVWKTNLGFSGSVDAYQIDVDKRFSQSPTFTLTAAQIAQLQASGVAGATSYSSISFFENAFNTSTRGVDVVGNYTHGLGPGRFDLTAAYSYTGTKVTGGSLTTAANATAKTIFEKGIPDNNATGTAAYTLGKFSVLGRLRYYGSWTDTTGNTTGAIFQNFGDIVFFDAAVTFNATKNLSVKVGAENIGDTYPQKAVLQASRGIVYSRDTPYDTNGGDYYVRLEARY
jgi:iron complex outermembrane receptor protein